MNILNPFKKKEDKEYKLNTTNLPSLSDMGTDKPQDNLSSPSVPAMPTFGSSSSLGSTPSFPNMRENDAHDFSSATPIKSLNSGFKPEPIKNSSNESNSDNSIHAEIIKTKIDMLEVKITLIEARLSNIEQKLELIFRMMENEVSEETRRKIRVDSMMNKIKN